jgi:Trypsin-co-occurring domain 1
MSAGVVVNFESGRKLYFASGEALRSSLEDVSAPSKAISASKEQFESAIATLGDLIAAMEKSLATVVNRPKKVEMEFGASLSGNCDLWIVSGNGSASFKVTLTWEK